MDSSLGGATRVRILSLSFVAGSQPQPVRAAARRPGRPSGGNNPPLSHTAPLPPTSRRRRRRGRLSRRVCRRLLPSRFFRVALVGGLAGRLWGTGGQAFAWISPVYVTAIKRGGGILLSSLLGVVLFGETLKGEASFQHSLCRPWPCRPRRRDTPPPPPFCPASLLLLPPAPGPVVVVGEALKGLLRPLDEALV